jgi:hypothetical protein
MEQEGILAKVQKLLDKAWSTEFDGEKAALLAKADELMVKYSIEQFQLLDPSRPNTAAQIKASTPEVREIVYMGGADKIDLDTLELFSTLFYSLATHNHVRVGQLGFRSSKVVGYDVDLNFLEMMFLGLKLHVLSNISPVLDPGKSWQDNLAIMKGAGYKWEAIHDRLRKHPEYKYGDVPWTRNIGVGFTDTYKRWCESNLSDEEMRVKANPKQWRDGFLHGYVAEVRHRLHEMRQASLAANPNLPDVLASKKNPLDEALWEAFPHLRPETDAEREARLAAEAADKRKPMRYKAPKVRYVSTASVDAGRRAARTADLSGTNGRVGGNSQGAIG